MNHPTMPAAMRPASPLRHRSRLRRRAGRCLLAGGLAGLLLAGSSSCVAQEEHDKAVQLAKHYQQLYYDLQQSDQNLAQENERLKSELAMSRVNALDAGFERDFETRLGRFEERLNSRDGVLNDIEEFDLGAEGYLYMVQDAVLFESGSAEVSAEGRKKLTELAQRIESRPGGRIWVRGHTDSDRVVKPATRARFPHGNIQLSAARAIEVSSVLSGEGGIPADRIAVVGFGPYEPLRPNDSAENKRINRRVEIFVTRDDAPTGQDG